MFEKIADMVKLGSVVTRIARDPEGALEEMIEQSKTENGKSVIRNLKEKLMGRYGCSDIRLEVNDNRVGVVLEKSGDVTEIVVKDIKEIAQVLSMFTGANKRKLIKDVQVVYDKNSESVSVSIPASEKMIEKIREVI